jgi:uncharacterized protein YjiS (DUF1127 family)
MPHTLDFDRYLRDYHSLTLRQRDLVVRLIIREAREERARAMREKIQGFASWSWAAAARGLATLRPAGVAVRGLAAAAWRRYDRRRRQRITAAQLYAMDDRELKDIGLRRGDIDFVLSGIKDPTRRPRAARPARPPFAATDYSSPSLESVQRVGAPLRLRNECAG